MVGACRLQTARLSPKRTFGGIPLTAMLAGGEHVATQEQYRWDRRGEGPGGGPTTFNGTAADPFCEPAAGVSRGMGSALQIGVQLFR